MLPNIIFEDSQMEFQKKVSFPSGPSAGLFARGLHMLAGELMIHLIETRAITLAEIDQIQSKVMTAIKGGEIAGSGIDEEAAELRAAVEALEMVLADHRRAAVRFG